MSDDKSTNRPPTPAAPASLGEDNFYQQLVQRHQNIVADHSRIEAKIRLLESQLEKALVAN
ncbi:MAG: hypothetical protein LBI10_00865 [Deltaproteobacteria bacterium]|nr:hypothetical protein [Deltaproteobacteria bacterium]